MGVTRSLTFHLYQILHCNLEDLTFMIEMPVASPEELRICTHTPWSVWVQMLRSKHRISSQARFGDAFTPLQPPKKNKGFSKTSCSVRTYKSNTEN